MTIPDKPSPTSIADAARQRGYVTAGLGSLVVGIGLAVAAGLISGHTRDRRLHTCDATLVLPTSGLVAAWAGAVVGLAAVILCVAALVAWRAPAPGVPAAGRPFWLGALCALSVLALLFEVLMLHRAYAYAAPAHHLCSGHAHFSLGG